MLYEEARVYLDHVSKYGSVLGLDSIKSLLGELGNPQKDLKFIHIAGTNGKGSILAGLSGILQQDTGESGENRKILFSDRDGIYGTISG